MESKTDLTCPYCARDIAKRAQNFPRQPVPGDYLICLDCTKVSWLMTDMTLCKIIEEGLPRDIREQVETFRHIKETCIVVRDMTQSVH